ncbi:hypothetical protein N658DRAFT_501057 [Parathielavia hyrcaniae]|uniref:Uncharacterized protein n=1 Tax=Parathielavia hyrcaniae TaxID=113614 RepID=A0AAN6SXW4_9PEZI|nr:hypothetical protein N658DRAFT_501057 [Parathielavia hyrcaniae]
MAFPRACPTPYTPTDNMRQDGASMTSSLDELFDHCQGIGATVQITGEGPGQTSGRRFEVQGGGKRIVVEENILALTHAGRKLLRDYRGGYQWTVLSSVACFWLVCV